MYYTAKTVFYKLFSHDLFLPNVYTMLQHRYAKKQNHKRQSLRRHKVSHGFTDTRLPTFTREKCEPDVGRRCTMQYRVLIIGKKRVLRKGKTKKYPTFSPAFFTTYNPWQPDGI